MNKKLVVAVLSVVLLIGGATAALAATTTSATTSSTASAPAAASQTNSSKIKSLYDQIFSIQSQIIDTQVAAGTITQQQADLLKKNLQLRQQYLDQSIDNSGNSAFGYGYGMMGGYGGYGGYGMMGGYYGPNYGQVQPGTAEPSTSN